MSKDGIAVNSNGCCSAPWITSIKVVISAPKGLVPSFMSSTAILKYSVLVTVCLTQFRHAMAKIELPVQVISDPWEKSAQATVEENNTFVESNPLENSLDWEQPDFDPLERLPSYAVE